MQDSNTPAFIVGLPRGGTTWLARTLNQHPDIAVLWESLFWGRNYIQPKAKYYSEDEFRKLGQVFLGQGLQSVGELPEEQATAFQAYMEDYFSIFRPQQTPREAFQAISNAYRKACGKTRFIEKTPHHIRWMDRISNFFPDAKFIILSRTPEAFMLSYKHQGDRLPPATRRQFERLYHPLGCALVYRSTMAFAKDAEKKYGDRVLMLQNESMDKEGLSGVFQFLGVTESECGLNTDRHSSFPKGKTVGLKPADRFWRWVICGGSFPPKAGIKGWFLIGVSFLSLPWWLLWNLWFLRKRSQGSILKYVLRFLKR